MKNILKKRGLLSIVIFFPFYIIAQDVMRLPYNVISDPLPSTPYGTSKDFSPVSPTSGSLGIYGQIPVGNYTGVADINIPLYQLTYKELAIHININYHTSGIKPDLLPGPVGLGWSLQAGGCITRVICGKPDYESSSMYNFGNSQNTVMMSDPRLATDWYADDKLKRYKNQPFVTPDNTNDPDIFYYNINGNTGKFYIDRTDTFRVQSVQGETFLITPDIQALKIIGFTMIDTKGIKYEFGHTSPYMEITQHYKLAGKTLKDSEDNLVLVCNCWHLASIESPNGYRIEFQYALLTTFTRHRFGDRVRYKHKNSSYYISPSFLYEDAEKSYSITSPHIKEIIFPTGKISFDYSSTNNSQLNYPPGLVSNLPDKLDRMHIYDNTNNEIKKIEFVYTNNTNTRLKLTSLLISGLNAPIQKYTFEYNATSLPPYFSWETDLYGYYNGKKLFEGVKEGDYTFYVTNHPDYINEMKIPDFNYSQAEILNKIIYPAKGYTCFEYEPHEYKGIYSNSEFKVIPTSTNELSGGIRIKKVTNYDKDGKQLSIKKYHYIKDYLHGGTISSGVLVYKPVFVESYKNKYIFEKDQKTFMMTDFLRWSTNPVFPLTETLGNHVTYSEVTVEEESGYKTCVYKNYDNGYPDKPLLGYAADMISDDMYGNYGIIDFGKEDEKISMGLERGQLLSEKIYDVNKKLKKETTYTYNDDAKRFNENVRFVRLTPNILQRAAEAYSYRVSAGLIYTYFPYVKEKTETEYLNNPITHTTSYFYDTKYHLLKKMTTVNSDKQTRQITYYYPYENMVTPLDSQMVTKRLINYPVKETMQYTQSTNTLIREYSKGLAPANPDLILLKKVSQQTEFGEPRTQTFYASYDSIGNPTEVDFLTEGSVCFIWSYNKTHPVAKIQGLSYEEVQVALTEDFIKQLENKTSPTQEEIEQIRLRLEKKEALVTTYTYHPLLGVSTVTQPDGTQLKYEYDGTGRLITIKDTNGHLIEQHTYHYAE